jgi:small subunit ribosomal protein S20
MPHTKSAKKRMQLSEQGRIRNRSGRTQIKNARRTLLDAVAAKDPQSAAKAYSAFCSVLDRSAKHGVIRKNNAVRRKARAAAMIRGLSAAPASTPA